MSMNPVQQLAAAFLPLIKLQSRKKEPVAKIKWLNFANQTGDVLANHNKDVVAHFKAGGNVGIAFPPHLMCMDIDPRKDPKVISGERPLWGIDTPDSPADHFFREVCEVEDWKQRLVWTKTPGDGTHSGAHVYFQRPEKLLPPGGLRGDLAFVEFKHFGGYVVAPGSTHPTGKIYQLMLPTLEDPFDGLYTLQNLPELLPGLVRNVEGVWAMRRGAEGTQGSSGEPGGTHKVKDIIKILDGVDPTKFRDQGEWFTFMQGINHASDGCEEVRSVFVQWCISDPLYAHYAPAIIYRWDSLKGSFSGNPVTIGSTLWLLKEKGYTGRGGPSELEREADLAKFNDADAAEGVDAADPTGVEATSKGDRPIIKITGSNREEVLEKTALHLFDALGKSKLFRRGTELVNVAKIGEAVMDGDKIEWTTDEKGRKCFDRNGVRSYPGSTYVSPLTGSAIRYHAGKTIEYKKIDGRAKKAGYQPIDAPLDLVDLVNITELWHFQELTAVAAAPLINFETGDVLSTRGILPGTGVLALFDPDDFKGIRTDLTQAEAQALLEWVHDQLYQHFPFEGGQRGPSSAVNMTACFGALLRAARQTG